MKPRSAFLSFVLIAAAAASGCASLDNWQRRAIFQPSPVAEGSWRRAPDGIEEFDLAVGDGDKVHAWYARAAESGAPALLFLHGARHNLSGSLARIERWRRMGFNVLAIDYRGFGRSTPRLPSEQTAIEDTLVAFAELRRREPDSRKRFVYGYSLGGALAIDLAARADGIAGVIVESTFTRIGDLVQRSQWGWVPGLSLLVTQNFDSLARIAQVNEPVLFIHGTADRLIPHQMADELAAAGERSTHPLRRVLKIDGGTHWSVPSSAGAVYEAAVREFVATTAAAAATTATLSSASVLR